MTTKELIELLEKLPQDAKVSVYVDNVDGTMDDLCTLTPRYNSDAGMVVIYADLE